MFFLSIRVATGQEKSGNFVLGQGNLKKVSKIQENLLKVRKI